MNSIELLTVHLMGTARMSEDRSRGVVSSFGEFHDAAGLFRGGRQSIPGADRGQSYGDDPGAGHAQRGMADREQEQI